MCGGGAKSPRVVTERMDTGPMLRELDEWSRETDKSNRLLQEQIRNQRKEVNQATYAQQAELDKADKLSRKLTAQQIKGSYRVTRGGSFAGAKVMKTSRQGPRPKAPLQINTGSLLT